MKLRKELLWLALRIAFGGMFVVASYYKIVSPGAFAHQIYNYKILPSWAINPLALTLPWLQFFCGVALIINRGAAAASALVTTMLVVFASALTSALFRHLNISCGCFKSGGSPATWLTLGRDLFLLTLSAVLTWKLLKEHKAETAYNAYH